MGQFLRPGSLGDALDALGARRLTVLAGGTDFYPARVGRHLDDDVLDIAGLDELKHIRDHGDHWRIGAGVTWTDLLGADLPACFDGLKAAARDIGGVQIQNAGTLAGNICNASPAADGVPNLLALDAGVELTSTEGRRMVPIGEFILGNRETQCRPDELVTAIVIPKPVADTRAAFIKLGARAYLVISIVMVAIVIEAEAGRVLRARVAVGACSPVACLLPALEAALHGRQIDSRLAEAVRRSHLREVLSPIDDLRGSAAYRLDATQTAIRRGLAGLAASWERVS